MLNLAVNNPHHPFALSWHGAFLKHLMQSSGWHCRGIFLKHPLPFPFAWSATNMLQIRSNAVTKMLHSFSPSRCRRISLFRRRGCLQGLHAACVQCNIKHVGTVMAPKEATLSVHGNDDLHPNWPAAILHYEGDAYLDDGQGKGQLMYTSSRLHACPGRCWA